ncbi:MAG TPA: aconitate hydratase [Syntrophales bacterium]|nr:aconitate hydratase [Syntrophales bacterium]
MAKNVTEKILEAHLVSGRPSPGEEVALRIDQTLTQDATGTMACLQFETLNIPRVRTELSVSYIDHNTVQVGFENADDHLYLQSAERKFGMFLSRAGNGICHQVHLERFGKPGKTLLGSDSHTPTGGGMGMVAIGAGGLDVAIAMGGGPFYLSWPRVIGIELSGKLPPWVSAKDVILKVLEIFTTRRNVGTVLEYFGEGAAALSVPERATITNMGAECGVTTSVFPSDGQTRKFLRAQGREGDFTEWSADAGARYDRVVSIDLSRLEPLAAAPHSPENIRTVRDLLDLPVQQVCIGSCTNSSYRDLATVAKILEGKTVHRDVSLIVSPGSRQVLETLARDGHLAELIRAGARIAESSCNFCIGNSFSPPSRGVSLRTSNRNFQGRSGTKDADVYLVSPETAAAAAISGKIADPRDLPISYPAVVPPESFRIDDGMILRPGDEPDPGSVVLYRGPNIGNPPKNDPLPEDIDGVAAIKVGDRITTDHIIPAGARMKYRSNIPRYSEFVFEGLDPDFAGRAAANRDRGLHNIVVAGVSYGQGSSREHAAICPMFLGVKVVIARSFERIHAANLVNFGIAPLVFGDGGTWERIDAGDRLYIAGARQQMGEKESITIHNRTKGFTFETVLLLTERQRRILLAGGVLNLAGVHGD